MHLPPPDAVDEDQALPTEVTEDLVSTVALGAVEDVLEPADDATEVTDSLDASVSGLAKTWRAKRDLNDGSQSAVAMPSADCLSAELSRWVYGPSGFFKRTPGKDPQGFQALASCLSRWAYVRVFRSGIPLATCPPLAVFVALDKFLCVRLFSLSVSLSLCLSLSLSLALSLSRSL